MQKVISYNNYYLLLSLEQTFTLLKNLRYYIFSLCVLFCFNSTALYAQELPPIINYTPSTYGADNQNWQASQADDGIVYIANNKGLLSFNGAQWHLNPSPNETILRSVKAIDDRVYTGAHMDFGYWEKAPTNELVYTSLKDALDIKMREGEQIWKIIQYKDKVLLQSLNGIYVYNPKGDSVDYIFIDDQNSVHRIFEIDEALFFQILGKGLFTIENGKEELYNDDDVFETKTFVNIFKRDSDLLGVTPKDGFYTIKGSKITPWEPSASSFIKDKTVYRSQSFSDGGIGLGTIAHGFIKVTANGDVDYQFTQETGLGNNTVLSIFEDTSKNIWVGLDNGIACISTATPITNYIDQKGRLGTTYASAVHQDILYLGTNQGLFYKRQDSDDFSLVQGTEEQVWSLRVINDQLFCGHTKGTFLISDGKQQRIADIPGSWDVQKIPNRPDLLLQGNYDGLYVLQRDEDTWTVRNKIADFNISSRHFEFATPHKVLVNNEYKGVYEVEIDSAFAKAYAYKINTSVVKGEHSSLEQYNDEIYYANKDGIFTYDKSASLFIKDEAMSDVLKDGYISGKLVNDQKGRLWAFTQNQLVYFTKDPLEQALSIYNLAIPQSLRNTAKGFENITLTSPETYLLGTSDGYLKINGSLASDGDYSVQLHQIHSTKREGTLSLVDVSTTGNFSWKENNLTFEYFVPEFEKFQEPEYQYRLLGFYDRWSPWETKAMHEYANIPSGSYTFEVRARKGKATTLDAASYTFTIARPWYASVLAMIAYVLIAICIIGAINYKNKRRFKKKQNELLAQTRQEMELKALAVENENATLRNLNLQSDIEARNRELAASTMSMINKSKTLQEIKQKLTALESSADLDTIISDIDKNISTKEDWSFFEEAFNHADKDFFKKVKTKHPELTTND